MGVEIISVDRGTEGGVGNRPPRASNYMLKAPE